MFFRMAGKTESGIFTFSRNGSYWMSYCDLTKQISGKLQQYDGLNESEGQGIPIQTQPWRGSSEKFKLERRK